MRAGQLDGESIARPMIVGARTASPRPGLAAPRELASSRVLQHARQHKPAREGQKSAQERARERAPSYGRRHRRCVPPTIIVETPTAPTGRAPTSAAARELGSSRVLQHARQHKPPRDSQKPA